MCCIAELNQRIILDKFVESFLVLYSMGIPAIPAHFDANRKNAQVRRNLKENKNLKPTRLPATLYMYSEASVAKFIKTLTHIGSNGLHSQHSRGTRSCHVVIHGHHPPPDQRQEIMSGQPAPGLSRSAGDRPEPRPPPRHATQHRRAVGTGSDREVRGG